jgi:hypothetical protein
MQGVLLRLQEAYHARQVSADDDVLVADRIALVGVYPGHANGDILTQVELCFGSRPIVRGDLLLAIDDHPAKHVAAQVHTAWEPFGQRLRDGRFPCGHDAGDQVDASGITHRASPHAR